ncbi:MAG: cytochrome P450 [Chloroflexota bacterium]
MQNRDQWDRLRDEPAIVKTAVEELLRFDSPVQFTSRVVLEDLEYKDMTFPRGTVVGFILGSANRDPAQFDDPWRLDVGREPNKHMAFGGGIHYCLGAPLARLEGEIAFATLAQRLPNLELATDTVSYKDNYVLRGLESLPVTF